MAIRLRAIGDQVIVVTGASSGIGLATANAAAALGARVVLVSRSDDALRRAVERIVARGGDAMHVVADVGSVADLGEVARAAVSRFGRIDTWVNNAGVGILGTLEETSEADMRQLFETNFWGCVNGSLVALPYLKERGGALINVGSLESDRAVPLQGIYSASKFAVKGFTEALRVELAAERAPVSVSLIKPGAIGTPLTRHMKDYKRNEPRLPPPVYDPQDAAATILHAAAHPTRDLFVGGFASLSSKVSAVFPGLVDWISARTLVPMQLGPKGATPGDNLFHGRSECEQRGDTQGCIVRRSAYTKLRLHPVTSTACGLAVIGLMTIVARGSRFGRHR